MIILRCNFEGKPQSLTPLIPIDSLDPIDSLPLILFDPIDSLLIPMIILRCNFEGRPQSLTPLIR